MNRLLTAIEVAQAIGMHPTRVYRDAKAGRIPHVRIGRRVRFDEDDLRDWLRERRTGGADTGHGDAGSAP